MPRHHAPLLTSIWDDPDFCALPRRAQTLYMQLLSQKRLSLVGVVPYQPRNWSRGCDEMTTEDVLDDLQILIAERYVLVDETTEELLVRTMLKHDPVVGIKSIRGMWNAWREVDSEWLRSHVLTHVPAAAWNDDAKPPEEAKRLRNAPSDAPSMPHSNVGLCSGRTVSSATVHHPPSITDDDTNDERDNQPTPQPPPRHTNAELWDAMVEAVGDVSTKSERTRRGKVVKALADIDATPEDVKARAAQYRKRWPNMTLTDTALEKHWSEMAPKASTSLIVNGVRESPFMNRYQ